MRAIGNPAVMRELTRVGMQSRTLMEWVLRIMANLLRPDEIGPAEAAYRTLAALVRVAPEPCMPPLVIAHRTCAAGRAARTRSTGIAAAARLGADVVEVDARRSRDGNRGAAARSAGSLRVQHVPLPVQLGARPSRLARLGVPTLADALEVAAENGRAGRDRHQGPGRGRGGARARSRRPAPTDQVLLWSQHMPAVRVVRARRCPTPRSRCCATRFDPTGHDRLLADAAAIGARAVSAHQDAVTPGVHRGRGRARPRRLLLVPAPRRASSARLADGRRRRPGRRRHRLARRASRGSRASGCDGSDHADAAESPHSEGAIACVRSA